LQKVKDQRNSQCAPWRIRHAPLLAIKKPVKHKNYKRCVDKCLNFSYQSIHNTTPRFFPALLGNFPLFTVSFSFFLKSFRLFFAFNFCFFFPLILFFFSRVSINRRRPKVTQKIIIKGWGSWAASGKQVYVCYVEMCHKWYIYTYIRYVLYMDVWATVVNEIIAFLTFNHQRGEIYFSLFAPIYAPQICAILCFFVSICPALTKCWP